MDTLTKEFFVQQFEFFKKEFDSFRAEVKEEFTSVRGEMKEEFAAVRSEMTTKNDLHQAVSALRAEMATKEDLESLAEMTSRSFTSMTLDFVRLENQVKSLNEKVDSFATVDYRSQIDVLRDDMRIVKTKLGLA